MLLIITVMRVIRYNVHAFASEGLNVLKLFFYSSFCLNSCPFKVLFDYSHYTPRWHLPEAMLPSLRLGPANTLNALII